MDALDGNWSKILLGCNFTLNCSKPTNSLGSNRLYVIRHFPSCDYFLSRNATQKLSSSQKTQSQFTRNYLLYKSMDSHTLFVVIITKCIYQLNILAVRINYARTVRCLHKISSHICIRNFV